MVVLAALDREEAYGLLLFETIVDRGVEISEGSIYPLLNRLEKEGKIEGRWVEDEGASHRRKYYRLTPKGRAILERMKVIWVTLCNGVNELTEDRP